jgi:large subunit ribosomal protein L28
MAQVCELTGKRPAYGNKVSHSNIKTRIRWMPNLRKKKYLIPELGQSMAIMLSSRAIRTIDKLGGISAAIMNANEKALSERLQQVRGKIYRARVKNTQTPKVAKEKVAKEAKAPKAEKVAKAKVAKPAKAAKAKAK